MIATIPSSTLLGIDGEPVAVEVHVSSGLPGFTIVGLPDAACRESRDRVRAARKTLALLARDDAQVFNHDAPQRVDERVRAVLHAHPCLAPLLDEGLARARWIGRAHDNEVPF